VPQATTANLFILHVFLTTVLLNVYYAPLLSLDSSSQIYSLSPFRPQTCLAFNTTTSLPSHIQKIESSLDRLHPPPAPATAQPTNASLTASDLRDNREREARSASTRRMVGVKIRVARGIVSLGFGEFEKAGREFGEVCEEGGLSDWEGQVS
jgi:hypothetical protein